MLPTSPAAVSHKFVTQSMVVTVVRLMLGIVSFQQDISGNTRLTRCHANRPSESTAPVRALETFLYISKQVGWKGIPRSSKFFYICQHIFQSRRSGSGTLHKDHRQCQSRDSCYQSRNHRHRSQASNQHLFGSSTGQPDIPSSRPMRSDVQSIREERYNSDQQCALLALLRRSTLQHRLQQGLYSQSHVDRAHQNNHTLQHSQSQESPRQLLPVRLRNVYAQCRN